VTNNLLPDLTNGVTKQFFCYGHGTNGYIGDWAGNAYLNNRDVGRGLGNGYSKTNFVTQNPYRFVFLDGCATASGNAWRSAFGIYPLDAQNLAGHSKVFSTKYRYGSRLGPNIHADVKQILQPLDESGAAETMY
jgi:hypothetical protein